MWTLRNVTAAWLLPAIFFFLTASVPQALAAPSEPEFTLYDLRVHPQGWLTIKDKVLVEVNITSSTDVKYVNLFYATSDSEFIVGKGLNYSAFQMYPQFVEIPNRKGTWAVNLPRQGRPVWVGLYVEATNKNNQTSTLYNREIPHRFPITEVPEPYVSFYSLQIADLNFGRAWSWANLTLHMQGRFPYPTSLPFLTANVRSIPHGYYVTEVMMQETGRFWSVGQSSGWVELVGDKYQYPYDSYILGVEISIPYPDAPLRTNDTIRLGPADRFARAESDIWQIENVGQRFFHEGNNTKMAVAFRLERVSPPLDPILVVGIANFLLLASAMVFPARAIARRLQVYLVAVVVPVTVLIGQKLNPFGFGITIYETYFSYVMLATAGLVFISVIAHHFRSKRRFSRVLDPLAGLTVFAVGYLLFINTSLPFFAKLPPLLILAVSVAKAFGEWRRSRSSSQPLYIA